MLLIAGGLLDPNLQALADAATALDIEWTDWRFPKDASPPCHWSLADRDWTDRASADNDNIANNPEAPLPWGLVGIPPCGAFLRQDVFAALSDPRPEVSQRALGWYTAVEGWLMAHPNVRRFNAEMSLRALNKPASLLLARQHGLRIPDTWVSNDTVWMRSRLPHPTIAKPVAGGGLCQTLEDALSTVQAEHAAMPALIQPRLEAPELRLFVVGNDAHAFELRSPSLDYRAEQDADIRTAPVPSHVQALRSMMTELRMDFGAADFKTDPISGELVFLELNTSPMFARFDQVSEGRLTASMVRHLITH